MKEEEFNLSEKMKMHRYDSNFEKRYFLEEEDVKEFIRLLKEELDANYIDRIIDKLVGDKLSK